MITNELYESWVGSSIALTFFMLGFFFTLVSFLIFFKKINLPILFLSFLVGVFYYDIQGIINHYFNPEVSDPQKITFLWMHISPLLVFCTFAVKKWRTFDRKVILVASLGVVAGWYVVHFSLAANQIRHQGNLIVNAQIELISDYAIADDKVGFITLCNKVGYDCFISNDKGETTHKSNGMNENKVVKSLGTVRPTSFEMEIDNVKVKGFKAMTFSNSAMSAVAISLDKSTMVIVDTEHIVELYNSVNMGINSWFGLSTTFWVFFMLVVLVSHKNHFANLKKISDTG